MKVWLKIKHYGIAEVLNIITFKNETDYQRTYFKSFSQRNRFFGNKRFARELAQIRTYFLINGNHNSYWKNSISSTIEK